MNKKTDFKFTSRYGYKDALSPEILAMAKEYETVIQQAMIKGMMIPSRFFGDNVSTASQEPAKSLSYDDLVTALRTIEKIEENRFRPKNMLCEVDRFSVKFLSEIIQMAQVEGFKTFNVATEAFLSGRQKSLCFIRGNESFVLLRVPLVRQRMKFVNWYKQGRIGRRFLRYLLGKSAGVEISRQMLRDILGEVES